MTALENFFSDIEKDDKKLLSFVNEKESLASFLSDYESLKNLKCFTQKDIAKKMGTTQSAISRIESLKTNPSYEVLRKLSDVVGGKLLITPMADMTVTVPLDLQKKVLRISENKDMSTSDLLKSLIRDSINSMYEDIERQSFNITIPETVFSKSKKNDYQNQKVDSQIDDVDFAA